MKRFTTILLSAWMIATISPLVARDLPVPPGYWEVYDAFLALKPDDTRSADVKNLVIRRDVATFTLHEGQLVLCQSIAGNVYAAIFRGRGEFSYSPPTPVEKEQLERFYNKVHLQESFKTLFMVFADTTLAELQKKLVFTESKISREFGDDVEYALRYLHRKKGKQFDSAIMKTVLDSEKNGLFYAHLSDRKTEPLFFEINPFQEEEVRFMRRLQGPSFLYIPEVINQFHLGTDYAAGINRRAEDKSRVHIHDYDLDVTLKGSYLDFSARAEVALTGLQSEQRWIDLRLFDELEIDSAFWSNGDTLNFVKEKDSPYLWVKCDPPLANGETRRFTIHYRGKLIERVRDWFYIKSSRGWYPKHGTRKLADFRVTYRYPDNFQFASAGDLLAQDTLGDVITSRWQSAGPTHNMSFNIGFFTDYRIANDTIPPVTVQMAETGHREIAHALGAQGIGSGRNMEKQVGKDVKNSMTMFQDWFGTLPIRHFFATDIPFSHGEAFPGLIHLSWQTFQLTRNTGDDEVFRAHEVAHQWWGIGVDFLTYHDQWISEAFAEYCGWMYLHDLVKKEDTNEKKFYKLLEERRKEITGNRKYLFGRGQKAGPIWLGYRTLSSDTQGDYRLIIYQKGAWVLHMIRSMLSDLSNGSDAQFRQLLSEFYRKYQGKQASTEDFMEFLESFTGEKWDWFFRQWVYGTDIPRYNFQHKVETLPDGQHRVQCRIGQEGVGEGFQMPVIIGVKFADDSIRSFRQMISGPETAFEIGTFPEKPKEIIFNHLESVLCEVKEKKWKD